MRSGAREQAEAMTALVVEAERRGMPVPEQAKYMMLRQEAERRGLFPWTSLDGFIGDVNPTLFQFEHIPQLSQVANQLIEGQITRLLVIMPPRYLKTEVFGRLLLAYFLRKFPTSLAGLVSYNATKAWEVSENARSYYLQSGGRLRPSAAAKKFWGTQAGGELWAGGVAEGLIGRGYHLGVVDDPIDPEKVRSPTYQRRFQDWWPAKWLSRQEPGARIVVDMQRLGSDDPIDFLLRREVGEKVEKAPEYWHVYVLDEIKSEEPLGRWNGPAGLPPTCTLINDPRPRGQILAPSRFSKKEVLRMQRTAGPYITATQRQQRPLRPTGDFWKEKWFRTYTALPSHAYHGGKDWDTAYSKEERNAANAWVESYRGPAPSAANSLEFPIYIHDLGWEWMEFPQLVEWMAGMSGPHYVEAKASGKSAVQSLKVHGVPVDEVLVPGDKLARASAVQPTVTSGRVYVREAVVQTLLMGEHQGLLRVTAEALMFGAGGLDLNDAFVQALHRHLGLGAKPRRLAQVW